MEHHQKHQQTPTRTWPQNFSAGPWKWDEGRHWLSPVIKSPDTSAVHTILELDTSAWGYAFSKHEDVRREDDANLQLIESSPILANALLIAERFMSGLEIGEQQPIDIALSIIRDALTQALGDPSLHHKDEQERTEATATWPHCDLDLSSPSVLKVAQEHWQQDFESIRSPDAPVAPSSAHDDMPDQATDFAVDSATDPQKPSKLPRSELPASQSQRPLPASPLLSESHQQSSSQADQVLPLRRFPYLPLCINQHRIRRPHGNRPQPHPGTQRSQADRHRSRLFRSRETNPQGDAIPGLPENTGQKRLRRHARIGRFAAHLRLQSHQLQIKEKSMRLHCSALKVHLTHCAMSAECRQIGLVFSTDGNPGIAIYQPRRGVK